MEDEGDFNDEQVEGEEDELDPNDPNDAFAIMERDFNKTYNILEEDPSLSYYAEEFSKLFDFLYKTRVRLVDLEKWSDELAENLRTNEDQLEISVKVMAADAETIATLKDEVENSHKLIDNAHAREQAAQEVIDNMRKQIAALTAEIDFKNKMAEGELEEDPQVLKHREGLEREKMKLVSEVQKLTEKFNSAVAYQEELEHRMFVADARIVEISSQLEETTADMERYKRSRDKFEVEVDEYKTELEKRTEDISSLNDTIATNQRMIAKYETQVKDHMTSALKCYKELEGWNAKYQKMQEEVEALVHSNDQYKRDNVRILQELRVKEEERARANIDMSKLSKLKEQAENKIKHMEDEKYSIIVDRNKLREIISNMEREIEGSKRQADYDRRLIENTSRERDILNKNILRQQAVTRDHIKLIKVQGQVKRKLELEIDCHVIETRKHTKQISYLEKERDRLLEEELELTRKIEDIMDDMKIKKNQIYELKKAATEGDSRFRQQQNLYDAVRADRNALVKCYQESVAENHELKQKLKTTTHQTEQMKEDIAMKEQLLIKEETILRKITKEKENMKIELNLSLDTIRSLKLEIGERKDEEKRLHKVIVTSDRTIRDQVKVITQLMNERDVLGAQLVRRNDEIALLYEKIKILQTTLHRGEAQYEQRLLDIKLLKVEIKRLRQEKNLLTKSINNMNDLKQEIFHLERDLTKERLKTKALEDELQNPMNVHRWRKLEGSDPELYELLQKITLLQRRLLNQTSQTISTERQLKETEKLYMNLRQVLSKQPGPGVLAELVKTQKKLSSNTNKMKCLVSELNLTETQSFEYKFKFEKVTEELNEVKKKLVLVKKEHARDLDTLKELSAKSTITAISSTTRNGKPSKSVGIGSFSHSLVAK